MADAVEIGLLVPAERHSKSANRAGQDNGSGKRRHDGKHDRIDIQANHDEVDGNSMDILIS